MNNEKIVQTFVQLYICLGKIRKIANPASLGNTGDLGCLGSLCYLVMLGNFSLIIPYAFSYLFYVVNASASKRPFPVDHKSI